MFMSFVFACLFILMIVAGGAALHMGLFKADRKGFGSGRQVLSGIFSYGVSGCVWFIIYSYHYLGW